jgi:hypothetical protein
MCSSLYRRLASAVFVLTIYTTRTFAAEFYSETKQTVVFIFTGDKDGNPLALGTGFLAGVKAEDSTGYFQYLVTAAHVLNGPEGKLLDPLYVRLNKKDGGSEFLRLDTKIGGKDSVFKNPNDPSADLAVIPVFLDDKKFEVRVVQDELILTKESFKAMGITEGDDVYFTGLFLPFYGQGRNYPVVRSGKIALISDEKIPWRTDVKKPPEMLDLYLLETSSFGGNSGSPVFVKVPSKEILGRTELRLIGIMKGTFEQNTPISVLDNQTTAVSRQNLGIAAVIPSYLLHDILFSEPMNKFRQALKKTSPATK